MARRALLMSLAFAMLLAAACASGEAAAPANVRLVTPPAPDATSARVGEPTATPTAIESPELILSAFDVQQGGALLLSVTGGITGGEAEMLGRTYPLTQGARSMYTFLPVGVLDPAGPQTVTVRFTLANGSEGTLTADVVVQATEWTVEYLEYVPAAGDAILDPVARENEAVLLAEAYATFTHEKLWGDTPWMLPVEGPVTSRFGEQRSFNGGPVEGHHGGSDFGAEEGTPVYATQPGRVVLARQLAVRGNMVVVDHGGGVLTGYAHLSTFAVPEGATVAQGEVIGFVGSTGLSTGAHLHWEMSIAGLLVDPLRFTDGTNGF